MSITVAQATAKLTLWMAADDAVSKGQSYTIGDRTLTRAHVSEIRSNIDYWSKKEAELQRIANTGRSVAVTLANFDV